MGPLGAAYRLPPCLLLFLMAWSVDASPYGHLLVTHDELMQSGGAARFSMAGVQGFSAILVLAEQGHLILGAKDALARVSMDDMTVIEWLSTPAPADKIERCNMYRSADVCHNFIRVLAVEPDGRTVLACGTNAFSPSCTVRQVANLSNAQATLNGVGFVPCDPDYGFVYLADGQGRFFAGVPLDVVGADPAVVRMRPASSLLRTMLNNHQWLNEPNFAAVFEIGSYVYFFFSETALESSGIVVSYENSTRQVYATYSRVARVCKNDPGTKPIVDEMWWTSFRKARLLCQSADGKLFDSVQSVDYVVKEQLFYGVFTSSNQHIMGSAICSYHLKDIEKVFAGPFRAEGEQRSCWREKANDEPNTQCSIANATKDNIQKLLSAQRYQLMNTVVLPATNVSLEYTPLERYSKILVDTVKVKTLDTVRVLFVLESGGVLKKFTHLPGKSVACLVEVLKLTNGDGPFKFRDFKLHSSRGLLFLSMGDHVLRLPVRRCGRYLTEARCISSKDPYCGWDQRTAKCSDITSKGLVGQLWIQALDGCAATNVTVDGGYSPWSEWMPCPRDPGDREKCLCRSRSCDSPAPQLGGRPCEGPSMQVTNCTVHGKWTGWTEWSGCSTSCGMSTRTRQRFCTNPAPSFGGRSCVGRNVEQSYCNVPACPTELPIQQDGHWSLWSPWRQCSKPCGGGFQKRMRFCNNPLPRSGGNPCVGTDQEYRTCNEDACPEVTRMSEWSQWTKLDEVAPDAIVFLRQRFSCSAPVAKGDLVMHPLITENKVCAKSNVQCSEMLANSGQSEWSAWSDWSECSKPCGRGTQNRERLCMSYGDQEQHTCSGSSKESRLCNRHPCVDDTKTIDFNSLCHPTSSWSCWSEFSECSATCGSGVRKRLRVCNGVNDCVGQSEEVVPCDLIPCSGEDLPWSEWSKCTPMGLRTRIRLCDKMTVCPEPTDAQVEHCDDESAAMEGNALMSSRESSQGDSDIVVTVAVVGALLFLVLLALLFMCCARYYPSFWCFSCFTRKTRSIPPPPTPIGATKCNIYTPPPLLRNGRSATPNIILNPLNKLSGKDELLDGLSEEETALTLKRNMLTSLNTKDYL